MECEEDFAGAVEKVTEEGMVTVLVGVRCFEGVGVGIQVLPCGPISTLIVVGVVVVGGTVMEEESSVSEWVEEFFCKRTGG